MEMKTQFGRRLCVNGKPHVTCFQLYHRQCTYAATIDVEPTSSAAVVSCLFNDNMTLPTIFRH